MTAQPSLTTELRAEVKALENDLRARLAVLSDVDADWRAQHKAALACGRTGLSWQEWSEERITQAAVAWVLTTVFIRFAEDNALVAPVWISGPKARRTEALNAQTEFLRQRARAGEDPTDRDWLCQAINHLRGLPATEALVDDTSALWLVTPSGDAASRLLAFWRERDDDGELLRHLHDKELDTRFLGDIYQDLSEEAKSRYALLQTPVFVEEFILNRTLEPALNDRPLEGFKVIDPTCGSGHFLLGAFARLLERWAIKEPGLNSRARVKKALGAIHGVDLNPFAVAIARFRLTIAALQASGDETLDDAPEFAYHLAVGDSLLHGLDELNLGLGLVVDQTAGNYVYPTENLAALQRILANGQYDTVVGNPPYITVKDKALNAAYRDRYNYLKGTYALTVPFMERFFDLAKTGERAGWVGQITSNSFMKREFGAPLIEKFFPGKDLRLIADTSGAYIPGHGTPTVIIVGRNTRPSTDTVRAVLGTRGEPGRPSEPADGLVWGSVTQHVDEPGYTDEWVTIADTERLLLGRHPWSLGGGGAADVLAALASRTRNVMRSVQSIGYTGQTNSDDSFLFSADVLRRHGISSRLHRPFVTGDDVRDYQVRPMNEAIFPYRSAKLMDLEDGPLLRWMWPNRTVLGGRATFGGSTYREEGRPWHGWHQVAKSRTSGPVITWAFVQTGNHFAYLADCYLHNRHAPVIKLPGRASQEDHLALLGALNSSTACFWLKQNSHNKGNGGIGGGIGDEAWEPRYEFTGATLENLPLPDSLPLDLGCLINRLALQLSNASPQAAVVSSVPSGEALAAAKVEHSQIRTDMIAQQEELDWLVYRAYGFIEGELTCSREELPRLALGERAFEIVLARRMASGDEQTEWFARHDSTPITRLPESWPAAYRELVERRIALIESHPFIRLLERPEYKRRWATEPWEKQEERALRSWLLDRLEDKRFWFDHTGVPTPRSVMRLADDVSRDPDLVSVLALWEGRPDVSVLTSLQKLLAKEAVPHLPAYRYKDSGLRKREAWEETWAKQRREDAGEKFGPETPNGPIAVPPKYTSADFVRKEYWDHRGKLDVPKERFLLYPDAGRDIDPTPVLGWAGWDHAQQAFAIDQLLQQREAEGWEDKRLIPLVAGLAELLPWVEQWHTEPDDFYGGASPADFFREQLTDRGRQVEQTREQLAAWRPEPARRGRRAAAK